MGKKRRRLRRSRFSLSLVIIFSASQLFAGEPSSPPMTGLRLSTADACALVQLKNKALLHIQATRIRCEAADCPGVDTVIPVPVEATSHEGVVVKAALVRADLEKELKAKIAESLISVSLCEDKSGRCGKELAQLLRLSGNYFEALEDKGRLALEFWVDARRMADASTECSR